MDQERLRALAVPVLLQILQQVVLEISTRMMEQEGGNGCGGGGGGHSYAGYGCGAHGDSSMGGGGGYTSTSSGLLEPVACEYRCYYCKNRCTRGHKAGHKHHTCHEHRTCRHWCLDLDDEPIQDHGLQSHPAVVHWDAKCCIDATCWFAKRSNVWGDLLIHCRIFLFCHWHWFCGRKKIIALTFTAC